MKIQILKSLGLLLLANNLLVSSTTAQFLFTYEINPESDNDRTPKSSLFDPASFKIVTPSQLQNSYQKLAHAQPPSLASELGGVSSEAPALPAAQQEPQQQQQLGGLGGSNVGDQAAASDPLGGQPRSPEARNDQQPASFFKQTSAALQSFAELFSLTQSSSPSPLSNHQAPSAKLTAAPINQEAEERSLHDHWTQQQQRSHQQEHQNHQPTIATAALNSFTTSQPPQSNSNNVNQNPGEPAQASYWLTANPLNPPDGNYLIQIKRPAESGSDQGDPEQQHRAHLVENLLAVGQQQQNQHPQRQARSQHSSTGPQAKAFETSNQAQASFLSTPTSYYPHQAAETSSIRPHRLAGHEQHFSTPLSVQHAKPAGAFAQPAPAAETATFSPHPPLQQQQLQAPANIPDNFPQPTPSTKPAFSQLPIASHHKSAEESLISFRQQQRQQQFEHQNSLTLNAPDQNQNRHQAESSMHETALNQANQQPQPQAQQQRPAAEIPKVSPQIYESFLLQQRDQYEKHMELLKQQQEVNKLMEQKNRQQQQEAELKRKRKKKEEAAEREAAARKEQELEQAKKVKLRREQEELVARKRREQEQREQLQRRQEEERRYREFLELREKEKREKEEAKRRRQLELEEQEALRKQREQKLRQERERAAELQLIAERKREKELEEAKYVQNLLRQQEELKKLLELKQKEDELQQQRRRQASGSQDAQPQRHQVNRVALSSNNNQLTRARNLALEHKERAGSSSWGAPIRSSRVPPTSFNQVNEFALGPNQSPSTSPASTTTTSTTTAAASTSSSSASATSAPVEREPSEFVKPQRQLNRIRAVKKQRSKSHPVATGASNGDNEKLIRQKIPLYSGPGQYGLYRGDGSGNDSIASDLAALLDSVTLPSSTTTTSTSTTTPAPISRTVEPTSGSSTRHQFLDSLVTPRSFLDTSSSLSPLLERSMSSERELSATSAEPLFDDDVPRRPARGLSQQSQQKQRHLATGASIQTASSSVSNRRVDGSNQSSPQASNFTQQRQTTTTTSGRTNQAVIGLASLPPDSDNDGIPGRAGVEYPVLAQVPATSFSCAKQPLNGYYADTETACQVVHLCQGGAQSSILCPNGTIFNQEKFSCQWWYEVNCSRAPNFYQLNDNLYKLNGGEKQQQTQQQAEASEKELNSEKLKNSNNKAIASMLLTRQNKSTSNQNNLNILASASS